MKKKRIKVRAIRSLTKEELSSQLQYVLVVRYKWAIIVPAACLFVLAGCFAGLDQGIPGMVTFGVMCVYLLTCISVIMRKASKWTKTLMAKEQPIDLDEELDVALKEHTLKTRTPKGVC